MRQLDKEKANSQLVKFFRERPEIHERYKFPGKLNDYASLLSRNLALKLDKRKSHLVSLIVKEVSRLLPESIYINTLEKQLFNNKILSYADHHGLLNFNLLYNSNLLYSIIINNLNLPYVVVLATGNIPLINISYPRGFYFKNQKFNFFRKKESNTPVFLIENKLNANINDGISSFVLNSNQINLTDEEIKFLNYLFFEGIKIEEDINDHESFSDQITGMNFRLWNFFFDKSIRDSIPKLVYLQSNKIIIQFIIRELLNENSLMHSILFDPKIREIYLRNFSDIPGCWGDSMGSHFFWGISRDSKNPKFISLKIDEINNSLVGKNFNVNFDNDTIISALDNNELLPTIFFDFLIVTFQEGFTALGGLNQIEYLPKMQKAHMKSLIEIGEIEKAAELAEPVANGLICGMMPFDFDSGIDLIWHYNSTNGKFNGNLDRGLTQEDLDRVNNTLVTELIATGIDKTLGIP